MRMAKIVLTLFLLAVLGIAGVSVYFRSSPDMAAWNHNSNNLSPLAERSDDDISYSQEVRTLTARLKQQADEAKEKDQARQREIDNLRQQLREQSTSTNSKLNQEVQGLAERNNALNRQNSELQAQMAQMQETLGQMQARQEEMANREPPDVSAQVAAELAKITGKTPEEVRAGATDKDTKRDDTPRENVFTGLLEDGKAAVNNLTGEDNKPQPLRPGAADGSADPDPTPSATSNTVKPDGEPVLPVASESDLTDANTGGVSASFASGKVTVNVPSDKAPAGDWVSANILPGRQAQWLQVSDDNQASMDLPSLPNGEYKIVIATRDHTLVGWAQFKVATTSASGAGDGAAVDTSASMNAHAQMLENSLRTDAADGLNGYLLGAGACMLILGGLVVLQVMSGPTLRGMRKSGS